MFGMPSGHRSGAWREQAVECQMAVRAPSVRVHNTQETPMASVGLHLESTPWHVHNKGGPRTIREPICDGRGGEFRNNEIVEVFMAFAFFALFPGGERPLAQFRGQGWVAPSRHGEGVHCGSGQAGPHRRRAVWGSDGSQIRCLEVDPTLYTPALQLRNPVPACYKYTIPNYVQQFLVHQSYREPLRLGGLRDREYEGDRLPPRPPRPPRCGGESLRGRLSGSRARSKSRSLPAKSPGRPPRPRLPLGGGGFDSPRQCPPPRPRGGALTPLPHPPSFTRPGPGGPARQPFG